MKTQSMLDKLILYFVYKTKGHITKTQLVKFLYLSDLNAVKWTGKPLTELEWYLYKHGPWHEDINAALDRHRLKGTIDLVQEGKALMVRVGIEPLNIEELNLSQGLSLMLDNIRKEWIGASLEELLEYVYNTEPMLAVKNLHSHDDRARLNLQLEHQRLLEEIGA